jgi:hypothetical protein
MKNIIAISFMMLSILTITSCTRSNSTTGTTTVSNPQSVVGGWRITQIIDDSNGDMTPQFTGYVFNFSANGTANVVKGSSTTNGTWLIRTSDDNGGSQKMEIELGNADPIRRVSKKWQVVTITSTTISLKDDNPASVEKLVFTKN